MKVGMGGLRFPPDVFWNLSIPELMIAFEGYAESKGVKSGGPHGPALGGSELAELELEFPDVPNTRRSREE